MLELLNSDEVVNPKKNFIPNFWLFILKNMENSQGYPFILLPALIAIILPSLLLEFSALSEWFLGNQGLTDWHIIRNF